MGRRSVLLVTSALAWCGACAALAQEANPPEARGAGFSLLDELVVTAQKREENLQDVPQAVSAYSSEQRDLIGIQTADDLAKFTPGMTFMQFPNRILLRGIGRATNSLGSDPGVATYYDGVYTSESFALSQSTLLIDRVEVLRGPQGTLYGRNSIGGAVNVISKRPAAEFEGQINQQITSYDGHRTTAYLSGPLTQELRYRLNGDYRRSPAFIRNLAGGRLGAETRSYLEGQLQYDPTDKLSVWGVYGYSWSHGTSVPTVRTAPYDTTSPDVGFSPNPTFGYATPNPGLTDLYTVDQNYPAEQRKRLDHRAVVEVTYDAALAKVKYVGGYFRGKSNYFGDFDETSRVGYVDPTSKVFISSDIRVQVETNSESFSNELNISSPEGGAFKWIVGLYQFSDRNTQPLRVYSPNQTQLVNSTLTFPGFQPVSNPAGTVYFANGNLKSRSYAVFAQGDWEFRPNWALTFGLRHTWDHKEATETQVINVFVPALVATNGLQITNKTRAVSDNWSGATGKLGLQWKPSEDTLAYASLSRGYKSGGYNLGSFQPPVKEESILAAEAGYKTQVGDNLQVNLAAFYYDYKDAQVVTRICAPTPSGLCTISTPGFTSVPKARSYGLELEAVWQPVEPLQLIANYGYLNATYRDFKGVQNTLNPTGPALDLSGQAMPVSPKHKATVAAVYTLSFDAGSLDLAANYAWSDRYHFDLYDLPLYQAKAGGLFGLRATWRDDQGRYNLIGFVDNVFDKARFGNVAIVTVAPNTFGRSLQMQAPRIFGVELQVPF